MKWSPERGELFINSTIKPAQEGYYQCQVEKPKYGKTISNKTQVIITRFNLGLTSLQPDILLSANIGSALTMTCDTGKAVITPSPIYSWQKLKSRTSATSSKDIIRVVPDHRIQIDNRGTV